MGKLSVRYSPFRELTPNRYIVMRMQKSDIRKLLDISSHFIIKIKNVVSSLNSLLFVTVVCFILASISNNSTKTYIFIVIGALGFLYYIIVYTYFMLTDPDRLQTETYQLKKQAIQMVGEKGHEYTDEELDAITNISDTRKSIPLKDDKQ